jgi:hypothetical protein
MLRRLLGFAPKDRPDYLDAQKEGLWMRHVYKRCV